MAVRFGIVIFGDLPLFVATEKENKAKG